jgi:hypothetical protein
MTTVLWISAVGGSLLFFALAMLVGLMYLLTAPWLFRIEGAGEPAVRRTKKRRFRKRGQEPEPEAPPVAASEIESKEAEQERRRRAAALAVATACAEEGQMVSIPTDTPSDWRHLHRARRLGRTLVRQRARL